MGSAREGKNRVRVIRLRPLLVLSCLGWRPLYSRCTVYSVALVLLPETWSPTHLSRVPRSRRSDFREQLPVRRRGGSCLPAPARGSASYAGAAPPPRPRPRRTPALRAEGDRPRASRILAGDGVAYFDATGYVTSAPSREAALGRWQAPGGSRSSTTEDGDERRRRGGGSGAGARGLGDRGGHDPGLGGGGAAAAVCVLFCLRDEGVAAAGGLSHREVPGGGPGEAGAGRGKGGCTGSSGPASRAISCCSRTPAPATAAGLPDPGGRGLVGDSFC